MGGISRSSLMLAVLPDASPDNSNINAKSASAPSKFAKSDQNTWGITSSMLGEGLAFLGTRLCFTAELNGP